jgi:5-methylcytosine-specific restriction protein A
MDAKTKSLQAQYAPDTLHALRSEKGNWYHELTQFPGVLFDHSGYIRFESEKDYRKSSYLKHGSSGNQVAVKGGISKIPGYKKINE